MYNSRKNRYSKRQLWGLDTYLAQHIHDALLQFKEQNVHSYPGDLQMTPELWHAVLDKCIWTFQQIADDYPEEPHTRYWAEFRETHDDKDDMYFVNDKNGTRIEFKYETPKWVWRKNEIYHKCIEDGLNLFARYYRDLWD